VGFDSFHTLEHGATSRSLARNFRECDAGEDRAKQLVAALRSARGRPAMVHGRWVSWKR
jgi:hypothetical protein